MNFDVSKRTIILVRHGSHAYGLNTPTSDLDVKGVCIEPRENFYGFLHTFEQHESMGRQTPDGPEDRVVYSLKKFMRLAADCNPNIIEVLHVDDSDILHIDEFGEQLRSIRNDFLSKKARHTFSGYAHAQLKRINTHRSWLLNPPKCPPERKDFGLSDIREVSKSDLGAYQAFEQMSKNGTETQNLISTLPSNIVELLQREKAFANAKTHWDQYQNWLKTRNPSRAALEAKHGLDTKHAAHLIRLMRMCKEILEGKGVFVKREDREELLSIRNGAWSYEKIVQTAEALDLECESLYKTSSLQHKPNLNFLHNECVKLTEKFLERNG